MEPVIGWVLFICSSTNDCHHTKHDTGDLCHLESYFCIRRGAIPEDPCMGHQQALTTSSLDGYTTRLRHPHTRTWTPIHADSDTRTPRLGHPYVWNRTPAHPDLDTHTTGIGHPDLDTHTPRLGHPHTPTGFVLIRGVNGSGNRLLRLLDATLTDLVELTRKSTTYAGAGLCRYCCDAALLNNIHSKTRYYFLHNARGMGGVIVFRA
jgi:hypothetical protein